MTKQSPNIMWFRQDLRLHDNPALRASCGNGAPILPIFILDDTHPGEWKMGGAARWWRHQSLASLNESLGGALHCYVGNPKEILETLAQKHDVQSIYWNRCYEPWRIKRDTDIKAHIKSLNVEAHSFNGSLLFEPLSALKQDGDPYKVFTYFYKNGCLKGNTPPRLPEAKPSTINTIEDDGAVVLDELKLMPKISWYNKMAESWSPGETGARHALNTFLKNGLQDYASMRDKPHVNGTSRLSPHLHHGEISPHEAWYAAKQHMHDHNIGKDGDVFLSELGWREFGHSLLYHFPDFPEKNFQDKFNGFTWSRSKKNLEAWQRGQTGYPIVDAGMRQLWQTGWMHNRVRMIVGSFLVKDLLIDWREGERWFWDTLVDADLANNSAGWQWIAGCGADASPFFRIFNPISQGEKFDPNGEYVKTYVPELSKLSKKYIHKPWEASEDILESACIRLGKEYPAPMVNHKEARIEALKRFKELS